jgi:hypothetical protein
VTGLNPGLSVHFDLYDETVKRGQAQVDDFAPFSHDTQSGGSVCKVPEHGSNLLFLGGGGVSVPSGGKEYQSVPRGLSYPDDS